MIHPLSQNWQKLKVKEIAPLQRGFDLPVKDIKPGNYPVVFSNGFLKRHSKFKAKAPGVVTGRSGTIGKVFFIEENYWPHNTALWVTNFNGNDPKFIYYFYCKLNPERFSAGSGVPTLNRNDVHAHEALLPPLPEQQRIVSVLEIWDKAIEKLELKIKLKKNVKKGLMQQLLTGKKRLPGFSGEWVEVKLGDVCKIKTGKKDNKDKIENGQYPFFVRSPNIERINTFAFDGEAILVPGEGNIGSIFHYIDGKFDYHQRVYKISDFNDKSFGKFIYYYLFMNFGRHALQSSVKATVDSLRLPMFTEFAITIPKEDEQRAIAVIFTSADQEIELLQSKLQKLKDQKTYLLNNLITGRIRIPETMSISS